MSRSSATMKTPHVTCGSTFARKTQAGLLVSKATQAAQELLSVGKVALDPTHGPCGGKAQDFPPRSQKGAKIDRWRGDKQDFWLHGV